MTSISYFCNKHTERTQKTSSVILRVSCAVLGLGTDDSHGFVPTLPIMIL